MKSWSVLLVLAITACAPQHRTPPGPASELRAPPDRASEHGKAASLAVDDRWLAARLDTIRRTTGAPAFTAAVATASNVYRGSRGYGPHRAVDGVLGDDSRWATDDGTTTAWLEVDLGGVLDLGRFAIYERFGRRVEEFTLSTSADRARWTVVHRGTRIGAELRGTFTPTRARFVRLDVTRGTDPTIAELAIYAP